MKEHTPDAGQGPFEEHSRKLFQESVDAIDMRLRSRLTQARHAALDAAAAAKRRPWLLRSGALTPAAGVTARNGRNVMSEAKSGLGNTKLERIVSKNPRTIA